jgi:hypothetical protein
MIIIFVIILFIICYRYLILDNPLYISCCLIVVILIRIFVISEKYCLFKIPQVCQTKQTFYFLQKSKNNNQPGLILDFQPWKLKE